MPMIQLIMLLIIMWACLINLCRDNHIMLQLLFVSAAHSWFPGFSSMPGWNMKGLVWVFLFHAGPTEYLYYWMHRGFHTKSLFQSYHSFHHLSVVPEPATGTRVNPLFYLALESLPS